ncbi:DUF4232 domain-containing protein [Streptomyces sp. NPDC002845]
MNRRHRTHRTIRTNRGKPMRTVPVAVTVLVAALALTACGDSDSDSGDNSGGGNSTACKHDEVGIAFGPSNAAPVAGDEGNIPVTVTYRGDATCTIQGTPGTDLYSGGSSWALSLQKNAKEPKLTLAKDESATFTISYVRGVAGDEKKGVAVDKVKFTLPGNSVVESWDWPDAEVAVKSEGELDATVSPFLPNGD